MATSHIIFLITINLVTYSDKMIASALCHVKERLINSLELNSNFE